jgi:hypothetical protein
METKKFFGSAVGIAVSIAVLYATVYFVSKAWSKGKA